MGDILRTRLFCHLLGHIHKKCPFFSGKKNRFFVSHGAVKHFIKLKFFQNLRYLKFDNMQVKVPYDYKIYLKYLYGNNWIKKIKFFYGVKTHV